MNTPTPNALHGSRRVITIALLCAGVVLVAAAFEKRFAPASPARLALALVQAGATAAVIVAIYRNIMQLDELLHRIMLEALALAFAGTGLLAAGYGFLERAGLPRIDWGLWQWPAMVVLWAVGLVIAKWRFR